MDRPRLHGRVIVITGGSSGIGLQTARQASAAGANVFLISRNAAALESICQALNREAGNADYAVADVADAHQLAAAAEAADTRFGRIDCWVSAAGVAIYAPLLETPAAEHRRLFDTNYFGTVNGASSAIPYLNRSRGAFVVVGSIVGDMPSPVMGAYAASKHAVHAFVRSLRIELGHAGAPVRITLIKPGGVTTPIAEHAANHQRGAARIPPPRYDPALVADAILRAAVHPVREETIGGIGRLEVLFARHLPAIFERIAPIIAPFLQDRSRRRSATSNLDRAGEDGEPRSRDERGRRFSTLALAQRFVWVLPGLIVSAILLNWRSGRD